MKSDEIERPRARTFRTTIEVFNTPESMDRCIFPDEWRSVLLDLRDGQEVTLWDDDAQRLRRWLNDRRIPYQARATP